MSTQDSNYKLSADLIRVVAGVMVVAIHISTIFVNYPPIFKSFDYWIANLLDSASRVAVPLFVMLSGMLLLHPYKKDTLKEFFSKRVNRIAVPMISWLLIYYLFKIFYFHQHLTPLTFLTDLISLNVYYHLYYLFIIVGLYLITPFLKAYLIGSSEKLNIYFLLFSFTIPIIVIITNYKFPSSKVTLNAFTYFLYYIPYFIAGHIFEKVHLKKSQLTLAIGGYCIFSILTAVLTYWQMTVKGFNNHFFYDHFSANVVIMSILLFLILNNIVLISTHINNKMTTILKTVSGYIFGIYLIHPLFMVLVDKYIPNLEISRIHSFFWEIMIFKIILIFGLSYIVVAVGKRTPFLKVIFG